jgi:hypothetical protein
MAADRADDSGQLSKEFNLAVTALLFVLGFLYLYANRPGARPGGQQSVKANVDSRAAPHGPALATLEGCPTNPPRAVARALQQALGLQVLRGPPRYGLLQHVGTAHMYTQRGRG